MKNFSGNSDFKNFNGRSFGDKKRFGGRRANFNDDRRLVDAVCDSCGKPCKVPFVPTGEKPVYCDNCYRQFGGKEKNQERGGKFGSSKSINLSEINKKLDRILELLEK